MELQLINAQFDAKDALDILTQMFNVKIKYHENKITGASCEEEIKMRENKIKSLQKEISDAGRFIKNGNKNSIEAKIKLTY